MEIWIPSLLVLACLGVYSSTETDPNSSTDNHFVIYKKLFAVKRKEQIETAEQIWAVSDYAKQYKTVKFLLETLFPILKESLSEAAAMKYVPDDPFPEELEKRDVLGKIYENVVFLGDVLLRMPDITKKIYREHKKEWPSILEEAVKFCNGSRRLFSGPHAKQLDLMAQEIGLIPEQDNYKNPFRIAKSLEKEKRPTESPSKAKKSKKYNKRPKLRGSRFEL